MQLIPSILLLISIYRVDGFVVPHLHQVNSGLKTINQRTKYSFVNNHLFTTKLSLSASSTNNNDDDDNARSVDNTTISSCWNPNIRKLFTLLSGIGMIETGYLTYLKVFDPNGISKICGGSGDGLASCSSVLNSPYATVQLNDEIVIPLTALGFIAYSTVAMLSVIPLVSSTPPSSTIIQEEEDDTIDLDAKNRIAILCTTTSMATFSSFLLSLLFNTLHQSCPYCLLSATLSSTMAFTSWFSGMLPSNNKENGFKLAVGSFATTTIASLILFLGVDEAAMVAYRNDVMSSSGFTNNVVASAANNEDPLKDVPPPPITSSSSPRALKIGEDMKELNTRFFGAYWCSHCYDQKQRMGREAMMNVQYIECSPEGLNSQTSICKERGVPGYPTWEIGGKLYPGEMYLDELEDIIAKAKSENSRNL